MLLTLTQELIDLGKTTVGWNAGLSPAQRGGVHLLLGQGNDGSPRSRALQDLWGQGWALHVLLSRGPEEGQGSRGRGWT